MAKITKIDPKDSPISYMETHIHPIPRDERGRFLPWRKRITHRWVTDVLEPMPSQLVEIIWRNTQ